MRQAWMAVACAFALGGCNVAELVTSDKIKAVNRVDLDKAQISLMQDRVKAALKDPASAQFGNYTAGVNSAGVVMVCGMVNAKNSFGGYTGMSPFTGAFDSGTFIVAGISGGSDAARARLQVCEAQGLTILPS